MQTIQSYCKKYVIFTTDINFKFRFIDNSTRRLDSNNDDNNDDNNDELFIEESEAEAKTGGFLSDLVNTIAGPASKAAVKVELPAIHSIYSKWNNKSFIHSFNAEEFTAAFTTIHDKNKTRVYDVLRTFREGSSLPKSDDMEKSIAELMQDPDKEKKIESYFRLLYKRLKPPRRLSLPYSHIKPEHRKQALVDRILSIFGDKARGYFDTGRAVYKLAHGFYDDESAKFPLQFPYAFEMVAVPLNDHILKEDSNRSSILITGVNYSVSPKSNKFAGQYHWYDEGQEYYREGQDLQGILDRKGFVFEEVSGSKVRLPSVIAANLISPRIDYKGKSKSDIDTTHFYSTIIYAATKLAEQIPTFQGAGFRFYRDRKLQSYQKPKKEKYTVEDVVTEVIRQRMNQGGVG
jgi:hypothetical protein